MFDTLKHNLLKIVLLADGGGCLVAGIILSTAPAPIAGLLGPAFTGAAVLGIGIFLIAWGIFHLFSGAAPHTPTSMVSIAIAGDALWVIASVALLLADWKSLTTIGIALVAVLAVAVADIMLMKMAGLGQRKRLAAA